MARSVSKSASVSAFRPARSPERERLAVRCAELRDALRKQRELETAYPRLCGARARAERALFDARENAQEARTSDAIELSRARNQKAQDELTCAERALVDHEQRQRELRAAMPRIRLDFDSALNAAIASDPATLRLVDEYRQAWLRFIELRQVVLSLGLDKRPNNLPGIDNIEEPKPGPLFAQWKAAIDSLKQNPDATLPDIPAPISEIRRVIVDPKEREERQHLN